MSGMKKQWAGKRNWKAGQIARDRKEKPTFDDGDVLVNGHFRAASPSDKALLADRDYQYARARRTSGWKNGKFRRQWERKARKQERRVHYQGQ